MILSASAAYIINNDYKRITWFPITTSNILELLFNHFCNISWDEFKKWCNDCILKRTSDRFIPISPFPPFSRREKTAIWKRWVKLLMILWLFQSLLTICLKGTSVLLLLVQAMIYVVSAFFFILFNSNNDYRDVCFPYS